MSDAALRGPRPFELVMYRLGHDVRLLVQRAAAWLLSRRTADTSIAWEDGETS